ncbi:MAG: hypothetical protein Q9171_005589 [Xanthocarpia ochracea]
MAGLHNGPAIFSTNLGRFAPRQPAVLPGRIILRSVPEEDMESKITELRTKYPNQCKEINTSVANLYDYFDHYDQELHGAMFLRAVLEEICGRNLMRRQLILDFTRQWTHLNSTAFQYILGLGLDAFTADDLDTFGAEFLHDALEELQLQKISHDDAVAVAFNREYFPNNRPAQHPSSARLPVHPRFPTVQRNVSNPILLRTGAIPPNMNPSVSSSTSMTSQVFPAGAPFPPTLQRFGPAKNELSKPPHFPGQQYSSRRIDKYGYPSHDDIPRSGFPDMYFAAPPPDMMGGQYPHYRVPHGFVGHNQKANRTRTFPTNKGPIYVGPSNDARILEHQGVSKGRGSFGERNMSRSNTQTIGPQISQSRQLHSLQQGQHAGPPLGPPPQGSGPPTITPSSLANEMVTTNAAYGSAIIPESGHEATHDAQQQSVPKPTTDKPCGSVKDCSSPVQPFGSPYQKGAGIHEASAPAGRTNVESTPPRMMQRAFIASQMTKPTSFLFSNDTDQSHGASPATHYNGHHFNTGEHHGHSLDLDECPLSDRKLWIGGLPHNTDVKTLARLLEPFGPCQLSSIRLSKLPQTSRFHHPGFTFAEYGDPAVSVIRCIPLITTRFQDPRNAADAVKALNGQLVDSIPCRLLLKPARMNPNFNDHINPPQKGARGYADRAKLNDARNDHQNRVYDRASQIPPKHTMQSPSKDNQLALDPQTTDTACECPIVSKTESAQTIRQPSLPSEVSDSKKHGINTVHGSRPKDGNVRDRKPSTATNSPIKSAAPAAVDPPSPPKKKKGRMSKDVPSSDKGSQAKKRKEMLSQLRTEKSLTGALIEVTDGTNSREDQYSDAPKSALSLSTEQLTPIRQESTTKSQGISASDLQDELEQYAPPQRDESLEGLSRVETASTSRRRLSSASLVVSTDPTSYAHSERSESGTGGMQTPVTPKDPESTKPQQPLPDVAVRSDHAIRSMADRDNAQPVDTVLTPADVTISAPHFHAELLTATAGAQLTDPRSATPASDSTATMDSGQDLSPLDSPQRLDTAIDVESRGHQRSQCASSKCVDDPALSETIFETFEKPSKKADVGAGSFGSLSPKRAATGPMQEMSPNTKMKLASEPVFKRGLPRNPRTLIAVPKVLPIMKPKAHTKSPEPGVSISISAESLDLLVRTADEKSGTIAEQRKTNANLAAASNAEAGVERGIAPLLTIQVEQPLDSNDQPPPTTVSGGQSGDETHYGSFDHASTPGSVAEPEGDIVDSAQSTPQTYLAAVVDQKTNSPVTHTPEQQPVIQQKKKKSKKSKKSKIPKPAQANSANDSSPAHSRSSTTEEIKVSVVTPKPETPYLADDNTPLPQPAFVRHNHSSMRSRNVPGFLDKRSTPNNEADGSVIKAPASRIAHSSASTAGSQPLYIISKSPEKHGGVVLQAESSNTQSSQDGQEKEAPVGDQPRVENNQCTLSPDERQARLKVLDEHVQHNNLLPIDRLLDGLAEVAPQESEQTNLGKRGASKPHAEESPVTLGGLGEPRVVEIISDDETQSDFQPSAASREQAWLSDPEKVSSLHSLLYETLTEAFEHPEDFQDTEQPIDTISANRNEEYMVPSPPSTRTASPERSRGRSASPVNGLGISIIHPASITSENGSPSQKQLPKELSWKEIATKSPSFLLQTGDIVEFIPKESDNESKGSQASGVVRKSSGKDPWRVPSAEQPWGKNNKSKGKPTGEASNTKI